MSCVQRSLPVHRTLRRLFSVATIAWAVAIPVAALAAGPAVPAAAQMAAALPYAIGAVICHQQAARSFTLWSHQLPVCARCTGLYAGAAFMTLVAAVHAPVLTRRRVALSLAALPTIGTLVYEWSTGIMPSNLLRAIAGVVLGAAVAWVILAALDDQVN
jgi:uncharacterized membrane protein